jgi:hypothetical protein
MTTGPKTVEVELTYTELAALIQGARPASALLACLEVASRTQRVTPLGITYFCFRGIEADAYALLDLAISRAPGAVPRIKQGLLLARADAGP